MLEYCQRLLRFAPKKDSVDHFPFDTLSDFVTPNNNFYTKQIHAHSAQVHMLRIIIDTCHLHVSVFIIRLTASNIVII